MATTFDTNTTTQQWMDFLRTIDETAQNLDERITICQQLVIYSTLPVKTMWVDTAKAEAAADIAKGEITTVEAAAHIAGWSEGLTLSGFHKVVRSFGTLAVFTNTVGNAVEQQFEKRISWHVYAIYYKDGVLGIYDPSLAPSTERLASCNGITLAKALVKSLKGKGSNRKLTEVWCGGGGHDGTKCQEMTRKWIVEEIVTKGGVDLGNWDQRDGWTKVSF